MKFFEYGKENKELVVMLHGAAVSYKGAEQTAKIIAKKYHVVVWAYDGFNPSEPETEFVSVKYEAKKLADYIVENYDGHIDILYGISFGGYVLMEVLADKRLTITTTIADGISLSDIPDIKSKLGKDLYCFFFWGFFYVMMGNPGPIRKKIIVKVTGRRESEVDRLLYKKATWKSWKNQCYCLIGEKRHWSDFARTDMHLWYGIKGTADKKLSASFNKLKEAGYPFKEKIFTNLGHGGLAGEQPDQFLEEMILAHESK